MFSLCKVDYNYQTYINKAHIVAKTWEYETLKAELLQRRLCVCVYLYMKDHSTVEWNLLIRAHYYTKLHLTYHKTSSISRTESQNLNVSHIVLQLSLPNPLKPNVKLRMKM